MIALWALVACASEVTVFVPPTGGAPVLGVVDLDTGVPQDTGASVATDDEPLGLCVNEFMADNKAALWLDDGSTPDWIELHNPSMAAVSLSGWTLTDDPDEPDKHVLEPGLAVAPFGFLVLYADDAQDLGSDHLSFKLSADGGSVGLYHPDGRGEVVHHGSVEPDFSVMRLRDCCATSECLEFDYRGTPGATNEG